MLKATVYAARLKRRRRVILMRREGYKTWKIKAVVGCTNYDIRKVNEMEKARGRRGFAFQLGDIVEAFQADSKVWIRAVVVDELNKKVQWLEHPVWKGAIQPVRRMRGIEDDNRD